MASHQTPSILQRIASGDSDAVSECLSVYSGLVSSIARQVSPNRAELDDDLQEVFLEIWRKANRFEPERGSEAAFIATVARNRLIDRRRRDARRPAEQDLVGEGPADEATGPTLETRDLAQRAVAALDLLESDRRRVIELSYLEGLTGEQMAQRLGIPPGTVKSHVRRGLKRLRELLANENDA